MRLKERGNAMFLVLIGVALFAALIFAIAGDRGDLQGTLGEEEARLVASEMIQYGDSLRLITAKMLRVGGVADTNTAGHGILFSAQSAHADYGVAGAQPTTEIFHASGGGASYQAPPAGACPAACAYEFTGQLNITGVETASKYELAMILSGVDSKVCQYINSIQQRGWSTIPAGALITLERFDGTNYGDTGGGNTLTLAAGFTGLRSFCYEMTSGANVFVHVLHGR